MKQISLTTSKEKNNAIIGKIVKDISYLIGDCWQEPQLIITFTDDTYICITVGMTENGDKIFENHYILPLQCYNYPPGNVIVDKDGNKTFKYEHNIEEQIRLGLISPDREREIMKIQEYEKLDNEREYNLYIELKKKYEPN